MIFDVWARQKAKELGMKRRTEAEMTQMKPGYYMDINANLAVINKVKAIKDPKRGTGLDIDADVQTSGNTLDDGANSTAEAILHWEFLGDL